METLLLTTEEVASVLGVSKSTIKRWTDEGKIDCAKTSGRHRKFSFENLQEFVTRYNYNIDLSAALQKIQHKERVANVKSFQQLIKAEQNVLHRFESE